MESWTIDMATEWLYSQVCFGNWRYAPKGSAWNSLFIYIYIYLEPLQVCPEEQSE